MKKFLASAILALAALAAVVYPAVAADLNFGVTQSGQHLEIAAGATKSISFTTPAGSVKSDVVFSDDPQTNDRTASLTLKVYKNGALLATRPVSYSRVRAESFDTVAGASYEVTVTSKQAIAFGVNLRYSKPAVVVPPKRVGTPVPPKSR